MRFSIKRWWFGAGASGDKDLYAPPELSEILPWGKVLVAGFALGLLFAVTESPDGLVRVQLSYPIQFQLRSSLGHDPIPSKRVKIYAMGDGSVAQLKRHNLTLDEWATVLEHLARQGAAEVFIPKIFGFLETTDEDAARFVQRVKALKMNVLAGAFISQTPVRGRETLRSNPRYTTLEGLSMNRSDSDWVPITPGYVYGPDPRVFQAFEAVGHLHYEGSYKMQAAIRTDEETLIPAGVTLIQTTPNFSYKQLVLSGDYVPLDRKARFLINFAHPRHYKPVSFYNLIRASQGIIPSAQLENNSTVILLPEYYTGGSGFAQSPFGAVPQGFVHAAVAHSVVARDWLRVSSLGWLYLLVCGVFGAVVARGSRSWVFGLLSLGGAGLVVGLGLASFVYWGVDVPWLWMGCCYGVSCVVVKLVRMHFYNHACEFYFKHRAPQAENLFTKLKRVENDNYHTD